MFRKEKMSRKNLVFSHAGFWPGAYIHGQRIFVDKERNLFVVGEALSI